jgi:2-C-methyl-D-erythritol 4-phosphate cytidylyltransferase/2-C-methyl-D-erythritol 2,4-cyclodiphosphate synthase
MTRTGLGFDSHRLCPGDHIMLGGIRIPCEFAVDAHSDGDVLVHALTDALLGTIAVGDIGDHFPDTDPQFSDAESTRFLAQAMDMVREMGFSLVNCDVTVMAEKPRLGPVKQEIRDRIASVLDISADRVSIKAKTGEGMGFVGRCEGIAAVALVTVEG